MVRYSSLLNCRSRKGAEGSIPSPSAMNFSKKYTLILVDAKWNNHKRLASQFDEVSKEYTNGEFEFLTMDVDENPELCYAMKVLNVPAICYFFKGTFDKTVIGDNQDIRQQIEFMIEDCDDGWDL